MAYQPKFPNCVDGNSYRRPRKALEFEALSLQMDGIYSSVNLSHVERANLLEMHTHLCQAESNVTRPRPLGGSLASKLTLQAVQAEFADFCRRNGLPVVEGVSDDI